MVTWFGVMLDLFVVNGVDFEVIRSVLEMKGRMRLGKTSVVFTLYTFSLGWEFIVLVLFFLSFILFRFSK